MNTSLPPHAHQSSSMGQNHPQESAIAHVTGSARYTDDLPEVRGTLHAAPIMSPVTHGVIQGIDSSAALAMPGVHAVVLAQDIPGDPVLAAFAHDEPIFAHTTVQFAGQVVGLIVATSAALARKAARAVQLQIDPLPAILTIADALAANSLLQPPVVLNRGDAATALRQATHRLQGTVQVGAQEHFYLEGQVAYALPQEQNQWHIYSSTQHPGEVQHWVAHALGLPMHAVRVECRRMGGGFGGKETQAGHLAVWAALAAHKTGRPVKLRLSREDDFRITGKRHPFETTYDVGFDDAGRITGLQLRMAVQCGFSADLSGPVADRAVFHCDNAYYLPHIHVTSTRCKTHTQSNTAFRGFGGPQGMMVIESIMGDIARVLGADAYDIRIANLYGTGAENPPRNTTPYGMVVHDNILPNLLPQLATSAHYRERQTAIAQWNQAQPVLKKGIAITPVKFGISFTATQLNQAGALVHVYTDGSVQVNHGGTEMGQGLHTKVAQIVADVFGLPLAHIQITASDTSKIPNASATAASAGTDLNGRAAENAALQVRNQLAQFIAEQDGCAASDVRFAGGLVISPQHSHPFAAVAQKAWAARLPLWSDGFYRTPDIHYNPATLTGRPFYYFAYGAACTEVVIDTLTGESRVLAVDILHDVGRSINPAIDIGQIEGGFVQGMGWLTTEHLVWNDQGQLLTRGPSTYKIPTASDVPTHFTTTLWQADNPTPNIGASKAVGEPPFMLALSVYEALRNAIAASQPASGSHQKPVVVKLQAPAVPEHVLAAIRGDEA